MCGTRIKSLKCVALTDNQGLFSNIHHFKSTSEDYRLHSDIIEQRQSIEHEKTVQEVRYVHSSQNLADCLTKGTKSGHMLLQLVRTGQYNLVKVRLPIYVLDQDRQPHILLSKPETEEATMEQFVSLPARHQPPVETNLSSPQFVLQTLNTDAGLDPHLAPSLQPNLSLQPNVVDLNTPVSHTRDAQQGVQVRQGGTGALHQVTNSVSDSHNANSSFFHGNIISSSDGGSQGNINLSPDGGSQGDQDKEAQQLSLTQHGLEAVSERMRPPSDSAPAGQS